MNRIVYQEISITNPLCHEIFEKAEELQKSFDGPPYPQAGYFYSLVLRNCEIEKNTKIDPVKDRRSGGRTISVTSDIAHEVREISTNLSDEYKRENSGPYPSDIYFNSKAVRSGKLRDN